MIFYDLIHLEVEKSEHPDMGHIANNYLTEISRNMGFSRRDKDLMVKVVVAQNRFYNPKKRSKKFIERFLFRDYLKDSLDFFEINSRVPGTGGDEILFWVKLYKNNLTKIKALRQEQRTIRRDSNRRGRSRGNRRNAPPAAEHSAGNPAATAPEKPAGTTPKTGKPSGRSRSVKSRPNRPENT